jgi:hypothetical protein
MEKSYQDYILNKSLSEADKKAIIKELWKDYIKNKDKPSARKDYRDKVTRVASGRDPVDLKSSNYKKKSMNKVWVEFKKLGVSESDGMGTGIGVNGGFGLNEEMERNDNKNLPQNIQNEKGMKRRVVGNEGYTDIDTPHTDSFYLPGKVKDEEADASDKTEGKHELSSDNKVRKKQPFNTGMTAQATIG